MFLFSFFSSSHQMRGTSHTKSQSPLVSASSRSDNKVAQAQLPASVSRHTMRDPSCGKVWGLTAVKSLTPFPLHRLVLGAGERGHCADTRPLRGLAFPLLERIFWNLYRLALGRRRIPHLQRGGNNLICESIPQINILSSLFSDC